MRMINFTNFMIILAIFAFKFGNEMGLEREDEDSARMRKKKILRQRTLQGCSACYRKK